LAKGKMTLPALIVRDRATPADRMQLRQWVLNWDRADLAGLLALIEKYEALSECRTVIQHYLSAARQALAVLPASEGRAKLAGLTHFLAEQTSALGVVY
jgi:geranylgeranyl pyrophosphate synthase